MERPGRALWFYLQGNQPVGPFEMGMLEKLRGAGVIDDGTPVKSSDQEAWQPFAEYAEKAGVQPVCPPASDARYYYLDAARQPVGPFYLNAVQRLYTDGVISENTFVSGAGDSQWVSVSQLLGAFGHQPQPTSSDAPAAGNVKVAKRRTLEQFALMMGVTLTFYTFYVVPSYSRDMKAITGKPRMDFQPLLILGIVGLVLSIMVAMNTDDALAKGLANFIGGLPLTVMLILWAYDLERHGKAIGLPSRQESLGTYVLMISIFVTMLGMFATGVAILIGMVAGTAAVWMIQKEINLYVPATR